MFHLSRNLLRGLLTVDQIKPQFWSLEELQILNFFKIIISLYEAMKS